jgi:lipoprotein LpqH
MGVRATVRCGVAAAVVVGCMSACSGQRTDAPREDGLPPGFASISIDGHDSGTTYPVTCDQIQWLLTIETHDVAPGFTVLVDIGPEVLAKFVKIRDVGGFTGSFWRGGVGEGDATRAPNVYSVTGTAYGMRTGNRHGPILAGFDITAAC